MHNHPLILTNKITDTHAKKISNTLSPLLERHPVVLNNSTENQVYLQNGAYNVYFGSCDRQFYKNIIEVEEKRIQINVAGKNLIIRNTEEFNNLKGSIEDRMANVLSVLIDLIEDLDRLNPISLQDSLSSITEIEIDNEKELRRNQVNIHNVYLYNKTNAIINDVINSLVDKFKDLPVLISYNSNYRIAVVFLNLDSYITIVSDTEYFSFKLQINDSEVVYVPISDIVMFIQQLYNHLLKEKKTDAS